MLASQKSIIFSVIDSTLASEFGLADSVAVIGEDAAGFFLIISTIFIIRCLRIDGDEESGGVLLAGSTLAAQRDAFLHVDIHRLDQVIRNLITNAVLPVITVIYLVLTFSLLLPLFNFGR